MTAHTPDSHRDLLNGSYKIFLLRRYGIEKH